MAGSFARQRAGANPRSPITGPWQREELPDQGVKQKCLGWRSRGDLACRHRRRLRGSGRRCGIHIVRRGGSGRHGRDSAVRWRVERAFAPTSGKREDKGERNGKPPTNA
jgi:hypothetical protein